MRRTLLLAAAIASAACTRPSPADPGIVAEWMHSLYGAIRVERLSPPVASRLMVYATAAVYSGFRAADQSLAPIALNGFPELPKPASADVDGALAAIAAERVVLDSLFREALPTTRAALARLADSLSAARTKVVGERYRAHSETIGRQIGQAIVAWSRADNFDGTRGRKYVAPSGPGLWVNDAPAPIYASQNMSGASEFVALDNPANVLQAGKASDRGLVLNRPKPGLKTLPVVNMTGTSEPYWAEIRPFALKRWDECPI
ncbi:MAG TPA: hypothetical protein VJ717_00445, partial [Gemmatimonadaceae bacterium]|nr:hypothetical protein [Gemmatimonadaceae bacterium]